MGADQSSAVHDITGTSFPLSKCRIVIVGPRSGDDCLTALTFLPKEARILATGNNLEELQKDSPYFSEANVLLNVTGNAKILTEIIKEMPFLEWIHSITAGVDHILCPAITDNDEIVLTNAKGVFSNSLAEYAMTACSFFAKDIRRLRRQQQEKKWDKFPVQELKNKTIGIVGYGSIGAACARLAKAYGMTVLALRRDTSRSKNDPHADVLFGREDLETVLQLSDFVVLSLALTDDTRGIIHKENIQQMKPGSVLINLGRGALINEDDLIEALQREDSPLAGAALDVFAVEPLPESSPLWELDNVLLSPHNADLTSDSRYSSVRMFADNCFKFLADPLQLDCVVDKKSGY